MIYYSLQINGRIWVIFVFNLRIDHTTKKCNLFGSNRFQDINFKDTDVKDINFEDI